MILLNNEAKTLQQLQAILKFPLEKIIKQSEFLVNENLKGFDLGSKKKRDLGTIRFPAVFTIEDKNGVSYEIRYSTSKANVKDKNGKIDVVFSPKKVTFDEDTIPSKIDLAVFMYLHPKCKNSPFRTDDSPIWTYEYKDKEKIAGASVSKGDVMLKALNHAKSYKGDDLVLMAKGMGIANASNMTELEIQASLTEIAMANPAKYLEKTEKQVTVLDGKIIDAIDKGVFIMVEKYGVHQWNWNFGPNKGQTICEITNNGIPANDFLITHIKMNLAKYYDEIMSARDNINADASAEAFMRDKNRKAAGDIDLKKQKAAVELPDFSEPETDDDIEEDTIDEDYEPEFDLNNQEPEPDFPTDFTSAKAYLTFHKPEGNASNKHASQLLAAVTEANLQPSTIREWVTVNIGY